IEANGGKRALLQLQAGEGIIAAGTDNLLATGGRARLKADKGIGARHSRINMDVPDVDAQALGGDAWFQFLSQVDSATLEAGEAIDFTALADFNFESLDAGTTLTGNSDHAITGN